MGKVYKGPSIDASYQVWVHLAKRFHLWKIFFKSANQKQELPVVAMFVNDRDEMSNLYRGPSIDASYQVSVHLAEVFQRRRLKCEKLTDDGRRTDDGCQVMAKAHIAFGKVS
jgi:predicted aminopeptidase